MKITPYKERTLDESKPVHVYRNLGNAAKERYSIRQGGLVVGHTDEITLADCEFKVSEAGRQRVLREGRKNVHAYIKGRIWGSLTHDEWRPLMPGPHAEWEQFRYNPHVFGAFLTDNNSWVLVRARVVRLNSVCNAYL